MAELEKLITELRERAQGRVKWFAMNKAESAYFIDFETTWEAGEWMDRQKKHHAEWLEREGVHIVEQRVHYQLETLANQAADKLEVLAQLTAAAAANGFDSITDAIAKAVKAIPDAARWRADIRREYELEYAPACRRQRVPPLSMEQYQAKADAMIDATIKNQEPT